MTLDISAGKPRARVVSLALVSALAVGLAASRPVTAAEEIFLRLDGVTGSSTTAGHAGQIPLSSYSQAFSNTARIGAGGGVTAGQATCGAITVMKRIDTSSPTLIGEVVRGTGIRTGDIYFVSTRANGTLATQYHVALMDVLVTEIQQMDHTPSGIMEQLTMSAARFTFTYTPITNTGAAGTPITFNFDCTTLTGG